MEPNGGVDELCGVGVSYLDVCDSAAAETDGDGAAEAAMVAEGLWHLLAGSSTRFGADYPCHAPGTSRWDITDVGETQQRVAHQSLHDTLTASPTVR